MRQNGRTNMTSHHTMTSVAHPVWAAWRIDLQGGHGLVAGWVRDATEPWQWHPVVAGAGRLASAGTPSTYPREHQRGLDTAGGQYLPAVVVELYTDEQTARTRGEQLRREYAQEFTRQADGQVHAGQKAQ
jgi:hypothetical protein